MTQEQFGELPLLLARGDLYLCGLNDKVITHLVETGKLTPFKARENGYGKYHKHEVAKILKLDIKGQPKVGAASGGGSI